MPPDDCATLPVLDRAVLSTLCQLDDGEGDVLRETVEVFLGSTPERIEGLRSALASGDLDTVERLAHMLKSSSGTLGGRRMTAACTRLERASRAGTRTEIPGLIERVGERFAELRSALTAELGR